jgi:hypothetical protein
MSPSRRTSLVALIPANKNKPAVSFSSMERAQLGEQIAAAHIRI